MVTPERPRRRSGERHAGVGHDAQHGLLGEPGLVLRPTPRRAGASRRHPAARVSRAPWSAPSGPVPSDCRATGPRPSSTVRPSGEPGRHRVREEPGPRRVGHDQAGLAAAPAHVEIVPHPRVRPVGAVGFAFVSTATAHAAAARRTRATQTSTAIRIEIAPTRDIPQPPPRWWKSTGWRRAMPGPCRPERREGPGEGARRSGSPRHPAPYVAPTPGPSLRQGDNGRRIPSPAVFRRLTWPQPIP